MDNSQNVFVRNANYLNYNKNEVKRKKNMFI